MWFDVLLAAGFVTYLVVDRVCRYREARLDAQHRTHLVNASYPNIPVPMIPGMPTPRVDDDDQTIEPLGLVGDSRFQQTGEFSLDSLITNRPTSGGATE